MKNKMPAHKFAALCAIVFAALTILFSFLLYPYVAFIYLGLAVVCLLLSLRLTHLERKRQRILDETFKPWVSPAASPPPAEEVPPLQQYRPRPRNWRDHV